jgi:hypothetical protein
MARRRKKPIASPGGCRYYLSLQEDRGQRRKVKGARKGGYLSLRDVQKALHRVAFSKRYNEQLRGGDELLVQKVCLSKRSGKLVDSVSVSACRPTVTGKIRCRAYSGYTSDRKRSPGDTLGVERAGRPGQSFEHGGSRIETTLHRIGGVKRRSKKRRK